MSWAPSGTPGDDVAADDVPNHVRSHAEISDGPVVRLLCAGTHTAGPGRGYTRTIRICEPFANKNHEFTTDDASTGRTWGAN